MFDWEREAVSCLPGYYRWTQWFFLKLYDMGLAYRKESPVDFCPQCNTTLAREQVWGEDRHCERCGTPVIKKELDAMVLAHHRLRRRTAGLFQDRLAGAGGGDADQLDRAQRGGRRHLCLRAGGSHRRLHHPARHAVGRDLYGAGPGASAGGQADDAGAAGRRSKHTSVQAARQSEIERCPPRKRRPASSSARTRSIRSTSERIPIWIADYVMMTYGTGAIMAVPAHDERDFEFAAQIRPADSGGHRAARLGRRAVGGSLHRPGHDGQSGPFTGTPRRRMAVQQE